MTFEETLEAFYRTYGMITTEEFDRYGQEELDRLKDVAIAFFDASMDDNYRKGRLSYDQIAEVMTSSIKRFNYTPDTQRFKANDYWSTKTLLELLATGTLRDDCDGRGREFEGIFYYLCDYTKADLYEAACADELEEGHYVCWVRAEDDLIYQVENRIDKPRTIQYMIDLGYSYWHYRPLNKIGTWYKPEAFIGKQLYKYKMSRSIKSDKPEFSWKKAIRLDRSKTLLKEWFAFGSGLIITFKDFLLNGSNEIATTLNANREDIGTVIPDHTIGIFISILAVLGIYLRTVTNKDINTKKDYDE